MEGLKPQESCAYQDDFDNNNELVREWLQCTSQNCSKWMHQHCLRMDDDLYVCGVCGSWDYSVHYASVNVSLFIKTCILL